MPPAIQSSLPAELLLFSDSCSLYIIDMGFFVFALDSLGRIEGEGGGKDLIVELAW